MDVIGFYNLLNEMYPEKLSAQWDNDGLMYNNTDRSNISRVLVALDPTLNALKYAAENSFDVLLTHHPMIFKGIKRLDGMSTASKRVVSAVKNGVNVISLHTRLDAADGGTNDALVKILGYEASAKFGDDESPELGRIVEFADPVKASELALNVKEKLCCDRVKLTGTGMIKKAAFVGGDGKDFILPAIKCGADALITGDAGYNLTDEAAETGFCTIEAGHYHTEFPVCLTLADAVVKLGLEAEIFENCPYLYL